MTAHDSAPVQAISPADFMALLDTPAAADRLLELIDGVVMEKMTTEEHSVCTLNIIFHLQLYLRATRAGRVVSEVHHRAPDTETILLPDAAVHTAARPVSTRGAVPRFPDLAVEVKSRANTLTDLYAKAALYLAHGTQIVWIVIPSKRLVQVITPDSNEIYDMTDTLTGGGVLPGFTLAVAAIFEDTQPPISPSSNDDPEG